MRVQTNIPNYLSFKEFNIFVNEYDKMSSKNIQKEVIIMPAFTFHVAVAKELNKELLFEEDEFLIGSIAPDCWRNNRKKKNIYLSHFQSEELGFENENYEYFYNKYFDKLNEPFYMGYLVHLITDTFYRQYVEGNYVEYRDGIKYYKLLDGTLFTGSDEEFSNKYWSNIHSLDLPIKEYYKLHEFKEVEEVFNSLPDIEEIEMSALNKTIEYANKNLTNAIKSESDMFDFEVVKKHITECVEFIMSELRRIRGVHK